MTKIPSPCYDCIERFCGCHSNCNKYKEYRVLLEDYKNMKKLNKPYLRYVQDRDTKFVREKHRKGDKY